VISGAIREQLVVFQASSFMFLMSRSIQPVESWDIPAFLSLASFQNLMLSTKGEPRIITPL